MRSPKKPSLIHQNQSLPRVLTHQRASVTLHAACEQLQFTPVPGQKSVARRATGVSPAPAGLPLPQVGEGKFGVFEAIKINGLQAFPG
jgi:hypothetical protein